MEKRLVLKKATRLTTGARSCTSAPAKTGFPLTSSPYVCEEYRSDYELSVDQGRVDGSSIEILNDSRIPVKGRALCSFTLSSVEECPRVAGRHSLRITFQFVRRSNVAESSALDGGPPFRIGQVVGVSFGKENTMEQKDGDERKDAQGDLSESSSDSDTDRDDESPFFVVKRPSHLSPGRQKLHFSLVFRRFYTRVQWAAVSSQNPHIIHLLEGAEEDGDVLLMGKVSRSAFLCL